MYSNSLNTPTSSYIINKAFSKPFALSKSYHFNRRFWVYWTDLISSWNFKGAMRKVITGCLFCEQKSDRNTINEFFRNKILAYITKTSLKSLFGLQNIENDATVSLQFMNYSNSFILIIWKLSYSLAIHLLIISHVSLEANMKYNHKWKNKFSKWKRWIRGFKFLLITLAFVWCSYILLWNHKSTIHLNYSTW